MKKPFYLKIVLIAIVALSFSQLSFAQTNRQVKFSFEGNKIFSSEKLSAVQNNCLERMQEADFDRKNDYCSQTDVRNLMFDKGFLTARIGEARKEETKNGLPIIIPVTEGDQFFLGEVKINGEKYFSERNILKTFPLKKGEIVSRAVIHKWMDELRDFYESRGFVLFDCEFEPAFVDNTVNLKFTFYEETAFKIRKVLFLTDTKSSDKYLKETLALIEGQIFNKQKLRKDVKKLNESNEFRYIDFEKDIDIKLDEDKSLADLVIHIKKKEK